MEGPVSPDAGVLAGKTIALPETRELDRMAAMLEALGARCHRCPLVAILDAPDPAPIDRFIARLTAGGFDDVIFLTGEGLRRLLARAEQTGQREPFVAALGRVRKITRGPKPARALHEIGLATDLPARTPTSRGVVELLGAEPLRGRRVGLQLYGSDPNELLVNFLREAGAEVEVVAAYVYAPASDEEKVAALIRALAGAELDALAFTSASQVDRLFQIAESRALASELRAGLGKTCIAAVGPIVVESLADRGITPAVVPEAPFVMKRLVNALAERLTSR